MLSDAELGMYPGFSLSWTGIWEQKNQQALFTNNLNEKVKI
jgi:hypothetical protein